MKGNNFRLYMATQKPEQRWKTFLLNIYTRNQVPQFTG